MGIFDWYKKSFKKKSETDYFYVKDTVTGETLFKGTKEEVIRYTKKKNTGIQGLMSYLDEKPNFKRIFNELVDFDSLKDEYSVSDYLLEADIIRHNKHKEFRLNKGRIYKYLK